MLSAPPCAAAASASTWPLAAEGPATAALLDSHRATIAACLGALAANDTAGARQALDRLRAAAVELRAALLDGYHRCPTSAPLQQALAVVCLALGRDEEGLFHLRRAVPGQDEWFAIGPRPERFRCHADVGTPLAVLVGACHLLGRPAEARALLDALRAGVQAHRIAAICAGLQNHVLWRHPEVVRRIRGVVQVGANIGDEVATWSQLAIPNLIAFEPVPEAFALLAQTMQRHRPPNAQWHAVPLAVGDACGERSFWQGRESGNSSFLPLHPERSAFHQRNEHRGRITVQTTTLDAFFAANPGLLDRHNLLFVDVQGTEHEVVLGACASLAHIDYVCLELSDAEIYAGSWTAGRMDDLMLAHGFRKLAELPNGWPEQKDALYVRRTLA